MLTGLWLSAASLAVVTAPAALAASTRHLAAFLDGTPASLRIFLRDLRTAWTGGGWKAGLAVLGAALLIGGDLALLTIEGVPGRPVVAVLTMAVAAAAASVLLRAGASWRPGASWKDLFATAVEDARSDLTGTGILLGGLLVLVVSTWALWILFVPMSGCLAGAALAVRRRLEARQS
ncbi:hypothetical protein [Glycomyces halotolerans]